MIRLLLFVGFVAILFLVIRWLFRQPPKVRWQWIVILVAIGLLLMVATGRAHWLTAIFAVLLPFLRGFLTVLNSIPPIKRVLDAMGVAQSTSQPSGEQTSSVQSRYIRMTLDHDSGDINGEVLDGQFQGRTLKQLNLEELLQLLRECQDDEESVALLQAYLDREYADEWQQNTGTHRQEQTASDSNRMSREEALEILGLSPDASEEEIVEAHRRLIQNFHPDRGGSAYLATKINLAKEALLGD